MHMPPGFVSPHLSLEFLAKAGMFHPQLPNLAGKPENAIREQTKMARARGRWQQTYLSVDGERLEMCLNNIG